MFNKQAISAIAMAAFLSAGVASNTAQAAINNNFPASGVCKAASGPGADVFYFDAEFAQNISTGVQYLTCSLSDFYSNVTNGSLPASVGIHLQNPNPTTRTVTCAVVSTHTGTDRTVAVYNFDVPGNSGSGHNVYFMYPDSGTPVLPAKSSTDSFLTMSCAIPSNVKLANIRTANNGNLSP